MTYLPQPHANRRAPRFRLANITPAGRPFQDGRRTPGELQVVSRAGGFLFLFSRVILAAVTLAMLCLGSTIYIPRLHVLK